jgi:hypothetical protein
LEVFGVVGREDDQINHVAKHAVATSGLAGADRRDQRAPLTWFRLLPIAWLGGTRLRARCSGASLR